MPYVVALSAIGAELASGNGFIASLHRQERRLRALDRVNLMILRPGAFFEGFYAATIRHERVVADSVAPEAKVPMIATADIAAVAAGALRERSWNGVVVRELLGPRDLTYSEAAAAIGAAIGEPDLQYIQLPDAELMAILTEAAGFARLRRPVRRVQPGAERRQAALARGSQRDQRPRPNSSSSPLSWHTRTRRRRNAVDLGGRSGAGLPYAASTSAGISYAAASQSSKLGHVRGSADASASHALEHFHFRVKASASAPLAPNRPAPPLHAVGSPCHCPRAVRRGVPGNEPVRADLWARYGEALMIGPVSSDSSPARP